MSKLYISSERVLHDSHPSRHSCMHSSLYPFCFPTSRRFTLCPLLPNADNLVQLASQNLLTQQNGAKKVVISDYATSTDQALMVPIKMNIERVQPTFVPPGTLHGVGHVWGHSVEELLDPLSVRQRCRHSTTTRMDEKSRDDRKHFENDSDNDDDVDGGGGGGGAKGGADGFAVSNQGDVMGNSDMSGIAVPSCNFSRQNPREGIQSTRREGGGRGGRGQGGDGDGVWDAEERGLSSNGPGFDILILADLLFNRSQHVQLLETCARSLARLETAEVWVSFSHHDPEKSKLDMNFFELASLKGFASMPIKTVR